MPAGAAAVTLFLAMLVTAVGTISQADPVAACGREPCTQMRAGESAAETLLGSLEDVLRRTECGLQQMAGLSPR